MCVCVYMYVWIHTTRNEPRSARSRACFNLEARLFSNSQSLALPFPFSSLSLAFLFVLVAPALRRRPHTTAFVIPPSSFLYILRALSCFPSLSLSLSFSPPPFSLSFSLRREERRPSIRMSRDTMLCLQIAGLTYFVC